MALGIHPFGLGWLFLATANAKLCMELYETYEYVQYLVGCF